MNLPLWRACQRCGRVRLDVGAPCPACGADAPAGVPPLAASGAFVGRHDELRLLHESLSATLAGRGRVVLLSGEAGMGKTRLAQEVATLAQRRGMLAVWGRCPEEPGAPPFLPWTRAMQACLRACPDERLAERWGRAAAAAVEIAPELAQRLPAEMALPTLGDAEQARYRLFAAVAHFWRQVAAQRPLLLILDNLHAADPSSLRLLAFLAQDISEQRLLLLGSCREEGLARQHPLAATLAELINTPQFCRLPLKGLSQTETERLVAADSTLNAAPGLASEIYRRTEGHPLFLIETLQFLHQRVGGTDARASQALLAAVPAGIHAVIGQRLNRLSPPCCEMLAVAACIGRDFELSLLSSLTEDSASPARLLDALDEALMQRLITGQPAPGQYQFSHALIREVLYDELPANRRVTLHRRIAEALRARHADALDPVLALLAHHAACALPAGDAQNALDLAARAAARATGLMAFEEAMRCYRLALQLQEQWFAGASARRCALLLDQGAVQMHAGDNEASAASFLEAATLARGLNDSQLFARAALGFENNGWRISQPGAQAVALLEEALANPLSPDDALAVDLNAALCRACIFSDRLAQARTVQARTVALARRLASPQPLFRALAAIVPARHDPTLLDERLRCAREALAVAEQAGHMEWVDALTGWHFGDLFEKGDIAGARALAQVHMRVAEAIRQPFMQAMGLANLTLLATCEGRLADAERLANDTFALGQRFLPDNAQGAHSLQIFVLRRLQGRLEEVLAPLRALIGRVAAADLWQPGLALLCSELELLEPARDAYALLARDQFGGIARDGMWLTNIVFATEVCVRLGDRAGAKTLYTLLEPYAGRNVLAGTNIACLGAADRYRAMLAALLGERERAEAHFAAAVALDQRAGNGPWLAHSHYEWARWLTAWGQTDDARARLQQALVPARELGMAGLARRCEALQRELDGRASGAAAPPGALSRRERAVLQLLSAGHSNQAISELLFISPHTVAHHVRHILSKTNSRNRTEAAAWAREHLAPDAG